MKKCKVLVSVVLTLALAACGGAGEQGPAGPEGKQGPQGLKGDAGNDSEFLQHYGCLYTWEDARKVCPTGWHLPSQAEFDALLNIVGADEATRSENLRAESFAGGKDLYGFSALPAGHSVEQTYNNIKTNTYFWTNTVLSDTSAYYLTIDENAAKILTNTQTYAYSVRCLKD
jgi:uncharacterized protein (TIGR02145 family)